VDDAYVEAVLSIVEQVPPGQVTTYGAVADAVGIGGPRLVGRVMSQLGGGVPWWRVVRADGSTPEFLAEEALAHWDDEGTPVRRRDADHVRVDLVAALYLPPRA